MTPDLKLTVGLGDGAEAAESQWRSGYGQNWVLLNDPAAASVAQWLAEQGRAELTYNEERQMVARLKPAAAGARLP
jgi:hypothetical protein